MKERDILRPYPFLITAFDGWNDACSAATNVVRHLLNFYPSKEVGVVASEGFYDYQKSRPVVCHVHGRSNICWPETKIYEVTISSDVILLVATGPEPNYQWHEYCMRILHLAEDYDVQGIITMGSMFADCPHTRDLPIDDHINGEIGENENHYSGPIGIPTVLESLAVEAGFETESFWVSVPQYLASDECAQGTLQLLRCLSSKLGIDLEEGDLLTKAEHWQAQASVLIRCNEELADYVRRLEQESDLKASAKISEQEAGPAAGTLVQEAEEFLKSMGGQESAL